MGETIGQYELLNLLGTGGFGTVYRARDTRVGRTVAVRVLGEPSADAALRARFVAEATPFTQISHPNVASLFDVGEHHDFLYLVYEFVPGERLGELAAGRPLNLRRALDVCAQAADGLADAHSFGRCHGALTPSSIVITPKGRVKILDFGLSTWQPGGPGRQTSVRIDQRGAALGPAAIGYMAPEQVLGHAADHRADIFALGVILYQMLTGRQPFEGSNQSDTAVKVTQHTPPPPGTLNSDVPAELDRVVAKAISKSVEERYDSAAQLAGELRAIATAVHQREADHDVAQIEATRPSGGSAGRTVLFVALLVAAIAAAGWTWRDWLSGAWTDRFGREVEPIVAVMPFAVGGGDVSKDYVGTGIAEELARRLGHVGGISVKSASSIRLLGNKPSVTVSAETGARVLLTGLIGPGPEGWSAVDVSVELVDGKDGRTVWTGHYVGTAKDQAALLARVARDVAVRLKVPASNSASNDRTSLRLVDPDAYDTYLQGLDARASGDTARASQLFQAAIDADPSLVEARAAQAASLYASVVFEGRGAFPEVRRQMREVAEEASTADPDLSSAHLAMALSSDTYAETFRHLRRATELDGSDTSVLLAIADVLRDIDPARAIAFARRAADTDPLQPMAIYQEAAGNLQIGQRAATLALVARGQAISPSAPWWDALRQRAMLIGPAAEPSMASPRSVSEFAPGALVRATALTKEGRHAEAAGVLGIVLRMNPGLCDARALLVGVRRLEGNQVEAGRLAAEVLFSARSAADQAPWMRCAAISAAGVLDADGAAFWITRAAADPRALRMWNATSAVLSPMPAIRQAQFPWNGVASNTRFAYAVASMESALVRARGEAAKAFEGLETRQPRAASQQ